MRGARRGPAERSRIGRRFGLALAILAVVALVAGLRAWVRPPRFVFTCNSIRHASSEVFTSADGAHALRGHFLVHFSLGDEYDRHLHRRDGAPAWRQWLERWLGPVTREEGVDCLARYRATGTRISQGDEEWVGYERE